MKRKVLACLLVCVIAFTLALPAFAAEPIQPRAALCANCGQLTLHTSDGGTRIDPEYVECTHGVPGAQDTVYVQYQIINYYCTNCPFTYSTRIIQNTFTYHGRQ